MRIAAAVVASVLLALATGILLLAPVAPPLCGRGWALAGGVCGGMGIGLFAGLALPQTCPICRGLSMLMALAVAQQRMLSRFAQKIPVPSPEENPDAEPFRADPSQQT